MKIVYCLNSIRYIGGIQRVTVVKANALAEIPGNEVWIAVTDNREGTLQTAPSPRVRLVDLDVNYYADDWQSRFNVVKGILVKRRQHRRRLEAFLREVQPDVVVSVGQSEKNFLPSIKGRWKTVREFHFARNYRLTLATNWFDRLLAHAGDWLENCLTLRRYDRVVVLTEEDRAANWQGWKHVEVMPNPSSFCAERTAPLTDPVIISVGRLAHQKNYSMLIRAFAKAAASRPDWKLRIVGEGEERGLLERLVGELGVADRVELPGLSSDVAGELAHASVFALSSILEGFPLVLVEAMECGLPVVSTTCPCGPKDIITDGVDGFLVGVNDDDAMADRLGQLMDDAELRNRMGAAALARAADYKADVIAIRWMQLFETLAPPPPTTYTDTIDYTIPCSYD